MQTQNTNTEDKHKIQTQNTNTKYKGKSQNTRERHKTQGTNTFEITQIAAFLFETKWRTHKSQKRHATISFKGRKGALVVFAIFPSCVGSVLKYLCIY